MSLKYHETNVSLIINLEGEMTASNSMSIREEITGHMEKNEKHLLINLEDVPLHVQYATLAAEDAEFYQHPGFSILLRHA